MLLLTRDVSGRVGTVDSGWNTGQQGIICKSCCDSIIVDGKFVSNKQTFYSYNVYT